MAVFVFHEQSLFPIYFKVKHRQPTEAPFYPTLHEDASIEMPNHGFPVLEKRVFKEILCIPK